MGATLSMSIIHPILFVWMPLCQLGCKGRLSPKYAGDVASASPPRAKLMLSGHTHDAAFGKFAGIFAASGTGWHSGAILLGNLAIFSLSCVLLALPTALAWTAMPFADAIGQVCSLCTPHTPTSYRFRARARHPTNTCPFADPTGQRLHLHVQPVNTTWSAGLVNGALLGLLPFFASSICFMLVTQVCTSPSLHAISSVHLPRPPC